jgi:(2Fe-2S) ferredoxin
MARPEFIEDVERLRTLAPVATAPIRHHVFVCTGTSCSSRDSAEVLAAFENDLTERGLLFGRVAKGKNPHGSIILTSCSSVGFCSIGPAVMIYPDGVWYAQVRAADVREIIEEHLLNNRVVERLALAKIPAEDRVADTESNEEWEA